MYDVVIIGGGICGCALLYELSRYHGNVVLLEKENDISVGTTKANSAIVHAGYDPKPGTNMAKYNVKGNMLIKEICARLDVPYKQIGSLVIALDSRQEQTIYELYERGISNGVPDIKILNHDEAVKVEPGLHPQVRCALYAPSAAIVSPWELAAAMAETAVKNGAHILLETEVTDIKKCENGFEVDTCNGPVNARFVVNAAGIDAATISHMAEGNHFTISPSRGQYYLMDKSQGDLVHHVIFQCPTKSGKGVLVAPTVHGNLIVGPNAEPVNGNDLRTTADGLEFVRNSALKSVPAINFRESIRNFSGLRANANLDDFIIGESCNLPGFFNIAGIKSPGLSSAPAIAADMVSMLKQAGLDLKVKRSYDDTRSVLRFKHLTQEERTRVIHENSLYGSIVCRCETITEGEIVEALHRPIVPRSLDAVKRRCGSGMGRCQGGFCGPRVQQIIARELNLPVEEVMLDRAGMRIITGETKTGGEE